MKTTFTVIALVLVMAATAAAAPPTFNKDIAPILYENCAMCHRPNEVAPFSLLTYQDAAKRAKLIASVTERRYMPPWKAEPGYGHFANERRLTDEQIALIKVWADAGAPEGDTLKPESPKFTEGWLGGKPDQILTAAGKFTLAADGPDQFRCFVLPLGLDHDSYANSVEFRPDNRRVVHHALVFTDISGTARRLAAGSKDNGYSCFGGPGIPAVGLIGGWVPGSVPQPGLDDYARLIPAGADIVVQIHYHPSGKTELDQSSLGLKYSGPPSDGHTAALIVAPNIDIPAGNANYLVKGQILLPRNVDVIGIAPHAHYLCKDMKVTAHLPDGSSIPLIWIKDWDFNWQGNYSYEKPIRLPKDTRIDLEYTYDNSAKNPRNPSNPPVRVTFGEQSTDEMAVAFVVVALPTPAEAKDFERQMAIQYLEAFLYVGARVENLPPEIPRQQRDAIAQVFRLFDRNGNGMLDAEERDGLLGLIGTMIGAAR